DLVASLDRITHFVRTDETGASENENAERRGRALPAREPIGSPSPLDAAWARPAGPEADRAKRRGGNLEKIPARGHAEVPLMNGRKTAGPRVDCEGPERPE